MIEKIKPCPFCGTFINIEDIVLDDRIIDGKKQHDDWSAVFLSCRNCKASIGIEEEMLPNIFRSAIIEKWNRRTEYGENHKKEEK